jgi:hypothetical protein
MTGNTDGLRTLSNYSKLPLNRIRYFPEADETIIGGIDRGILFLMAFWSGPSLKAFASITETVLRLDTSHALELVVVDLDGSPAVCTVPEFTGKIQGAGESAWVRNGSIVATSGFGLNIECFAPNTKLLLEKP